MPHTLTVDMLGAAIGIDLSGLDAPHQQEARDAWADALAADGLAPITTVAPDAHLDGPHALEQLSQRVTLAGIAAPGPNRKADRSRFFPGLAAAMAAQWGGFASDPEQFSLFE